MVVAHHRTTDPLLVQSPDGSAIASKQCDALRGSHYRALCHSRCEYPADEGLPIVSALTIPAVLSLSAKAIGAFLGAQLGSRDAVRQSYEVASGG